MVTDTSPGVPRQRVPADPVPLAAAIAEWLELSGIGWYHRGPCGCGSDGCWVLIADGDDPLPEIHCPARPA